MDKLPRDLILNILSRLPVTSLQRAKCVCRSWLAFVQDPHLVNTHFSRTLAEDPILILHSDCPIKNKLSFIDDFTSCNPYNETTVLKKIEAPTMTEFEVVGSCNGLLCLSSSSDNNENTIYVFNPFRRDLLELPKSPQYPNQEVVVGFGYHPRIKEYKVVKIVNHLNSHSNHPHHPLPISEIQIFTLGGTAWRTGDYVYYHLFRDPSQVLVNGRLHWLSWRHRHIQIFILVSFDLEDEQFRLVPKPDCCGSTRCGYQLAVLGGCLSATAFCNNGNFEIWVMKEYGVKASWVKEFNIGTYMPRSLEQDLDEMFKISKFYLNSGFVKVVCLLKNWEILLEYECRALVTYDPKLATFKEIMLQEMPGLFETVVHVGSLNWIDSIMDVQE